jgi:flagellar biosynthetic protein FliP
MWYRVSIFSVFAFSLLCPAHVCIAQVVDGAVQSRLSRNTADSRNNLGAGETLQDEDELSSESAGGQSDSERSLPLNVSGVDVLTKGPDGWVSPEGLFGSVQTIGVLTVLSMAPAILLMTTCYIRIVIVLGILKQAIGLQSLPPTQVLTSIALFMTLFVMTPVWQSVYRDAIKPYTEQVTPVSLEEAYSAGVRPVRQFMSRQIDITGNHDDVHLFYEYMDSSAPAPTGFEDVPIRVLLPAFVLSELKTAFLMGFQIFLPFLVVDLIVASVTISMGMLMLPPQVVSLPFKLLLFVLVDGWHLVVQMLMDSFGNVL